MSDIPQGVLDCIKQVAGMEEALTTLKNDNHIIFSKLDDLSGFRWKVIGYSIGFSTAISLAVGCITLYLRH